MQKSKQNHYSFIFSESEVKDLKELLWHERCELSGRPATDFLAKKYEAILQKIVLQKSETGVVDYY